MKKVVASLLMAGASALVLGACSVEQSAKSVVGQSVGNFQLIDHQGKAQELFYQPADTRAVVIVTQANGDETSRKSAAALEALKASYADKGVVFYMLNASLADDRASIATEVAGLGTDIPVLDDELQFVTAALGATKTGEAFVIDAKTKKIVYQGAVDASTGAKAAGYLGEALAAVTSDQPVAVSFVAAKGAAIAMPDFENKAAWSNISYTKDVAPILKANCVDCHEPGGIGPWHMTSYETIKGFAPMMREVLMTDRMPPYNADPHVGSFKENQNLSADDMKTLIKWIDAGAPRGEGEDPLEAAKLQRAEWPLGEPDLIVEIPPYKIPASGVVEYQMPAVASPLQEAKWLKATTFKAGSREGVHHILAGWMPEMPANGRGFSWNTSLGGYAVGAEHNKTPENWGTYIPAGGAMSFQMHYTPFGKEVTDVSKIGLYFADEAPELVMRQITIADPTIEILPNVARHPERGYMVVPADMQIYSVQPHAHYRGYSSKLTLRTPDGAERELISLPRYNFEWQREYILEDLVDVPAGSLLIADYEYDNSASNPANPDPSKTVNWGDQSFEEMLFTAIRYRWADETASNRMDDVQDAFENSMLFTVIDDNINGKIDVAEMKSPMLAEMKPALPKFDKDGDGALAPEEFAALGQAMQEARSRDRAARRAQGQAGGQP